MSLQNTQAQVDEVVDLMRDNVSRVLERDSKLADLETKAETLQDGAVRFERTSTQVQKKMWTKNLKWTLALILAIVILIVVVLCMSQ